nr:hypothetical protein [Neobacillus sp. Marseille-Q6967]
MFFTKEEMAVKTEWLQKFLADHKDAPFEVRKLLVAYFCEEWQFKIDLTKPLMPHPYSRKKDRGLYSVHDILTDYLLDVDQVAERSEEYPVENADKRARRTNKMQKSELSIVFDGEQVGEDYRTPSFSIEESALSGRDPIEELFFAESCAETVEELAELISEVKENEVYYVNKYSDETAWNEKQPDKLRTIRNVRTSIRTLNIKRVRECKECGGAFYAHDWRRHICDAQKYPGSEKSACEVKNHRKRGKNPNLAQKKAIIQ